MSSEKPSSVNCLLMQVNGYNLLLPQSSIAEVIRIPELQSADSSESWLKGSFEWRKQRVPLLSFEELCGWGTKKKLASSWAVVIYALTQAHGLVFYALEIHTTPRPLEVAEEAIEERSSINPASDHEVIASHVRVNGLNAVIPSIPRIESMLHEQFG